MKMVIRNIVQWDTILIFQSVYSIHLFNLLCISQEGNSNDEGIKIKAMELFCCCPPAENIVENRLSKYSPATISSNCSSCGLKFNFKLNSDVNITSGQTEKQSSTYERWILPEENAKILADNNMFSCHICEYKSIVKSSLSRHLLTHSKNVLSACDHCDYKTSNKYNLIRHMLIHSGERSFSCHICDYKASLRDGLERHILIHSDERKFSCGECEFKTNKRSNLRTHMRIHTGEKPFSCHICDYKTSRKCTLNNHISNHSGVWKFSCAECDYKTNERTYLKRHMKVHNGLSEHVWSIV